MDTTLIEEIVKMHIGLIGCGRWGKYILRDLKTLGCEVTVVAHSPTSVSNATQFQADYIVESVDTLTSIGLDGVIVATPTATHAEVIDQVIPLNCPIFVEKPLCNNSIQAEKLLSVAGERLFVMDKWKYHNGILKIAELINSQELGKIKQIILKRKQWRSPHTDVDPIWVLMPHDISIAQLFLGITPDPIFAKGNVLEDDHINSMCCILTANTPESVDVILEVSADSVVTERSVTVVGEKATVFLDSAYSETLLLCRNGKHQFGEEPEKIPFKNNMPLFDEIRRFVDYLSNPLLEMQSKATNGAATVALIEKLRAMTLGLHKN